MIRDITIGQYYDAPSPIHKMDPRTKILWTLFYMIALFVIEGLWSYLAIIALTAIIIWVSQIPLKFMMRGLKPIILLVVITAALNLFMTPGENVLFEKGSFTITLEGVYMGDGSIDAAFQAIEKIVGRHYELDDFQLQAVTEGREAMGQTIVKLRSGAKVYSGIGISTDIVGAGIQAYLSALNKIIYEEEV